MVGCRTSPFVFAETVYIHSNYNVNAEQLVFYVIIQTESYLVSMQRIKMHPYYFKSFTIFLTKKFFFYNVFRWTVNDITRATRWQVPYRWR